MVSWAITGQICGLTEHLVKDIGIEADSVGQGVGFAVNLYRVEDDHVAKKFDRRCCDVVRSSSED